MNCTVVEYLRPNGTNQHPKLEVHPWSRAIRNDHDPRFNWSFFGGNVSADGSPKR